MIKKFLHRAAWRTEKLFDNIRGQRDKRRIIEPYLGYAEPDALVVRGRVLAALRRNKPKPDQSKLTNMRQMVSLFLTDEVSEVVVEAGGVRAVTDEEGYFILRIPRISQEGWVDVDVHLVNENVSVICHVLVPQQDARFGVISDIDDTMLQTGAYSLARNLWTSFTGNMLSRKIFPDAVELINQLSAQGRNPIYYVSSSPWNLFHFLASIFERAKLVRGPMFLRDLGISSDQFITGTHGDHKGAAINTLLAANPDLPFVLIGDTGQHDAFVYRDAIRRHPDRIKAIILREPGPGPDAESLAAINEIQAEGVTVYHAPDYRGIVEQLYSGPLAQMN